MGAAPSHGAWPPLAALVVAACSAGGAADRVPSADAAGGGGGADSVAGEGGVGTMLGAGGVIGVGGGGERTTVPVVRRTLPPPWQYYEDGSEHAYKDDSLTDTVREQFDGAPASSGQPEIVYPLEGSMHPMNLGDITFQWTQGDATNTVFRIEVRAGTETFFFFVPCSTQRCTYALPESEWLDLGERFRGSAIVVVVSGTDGSGGAVATSAELGILFSPEAVTGALYYWASMGGEIKRATFGAKKATPYITPLSATNEYACAACHSVSRDGSTIAFAVTEPSGENISGIQTAPTDDPESPFVRPTRGPTPYPDALAHGNTMGPTDHLGHNVALSPEGNLAVVNGIPTEEPNWPPYLELRETRTGQSLGKWSLGDPAFGPNRLGILPEWSPDGQRLAVTLADATGDSADQGCVWTSDTCRSSIAVLSFDGRDSFVGEPDILVAHSGDEYHFYPTWSPDGQYIAFVTAARDPNNPDDKSLSQQNGILRLVRSEGGPHACPGTDCWELANGTQYTLEDALAGRGLGSTWPKFTPFAQGATDDIFFVSFTSRIAYGFTEGQTQLWMFGVDIERIASGQDPSFPPLWLPYQELNDRSLTPYWTEILPCEANADGECSGCVAGEQCLVDEAANTCQCAAVQVR